ncbi:MAG TPA: hypothetical protein VLU43_07145 [Anaeromyxobacteraceae bacterium]|nr:hypothetical protein [Anaeromyxobacteraceae bacterium]
MRAAPEGGAGRAPAAALPSRRRATLLALAELRGRLLWRRLRGRSGVPELVARITSFAIALPAALLFAGLAGAGSLAAARAGRGVQVDATVTALFFGVWQTWTVVSLSLAEREALDLRRYLLYPLPPGRVWAYGLAASVVGDPFAVFWCVILAGAFGGAALGRPGGWLAPLALVFALFVVGTVALVSLLQEILARALRGKRARALAIAALYLLLTAALAWASGGHRLNGIEALRKAALFQWIAYPAALAAGAGRALYAGRLAEAVPWVAGQLAAAVATALLAYRLALAAALSGGEGTTGRATPGGRGWPTGFLPGRLGPLVEKEAKYLLRHPLAAILALVVPAFAALVAWKVAPRIPAEAGEVLRALPLMAFALYTHLVTQAFWLNAFGWERGGARIWFLAPVAPAQVVLAKNAATYVFALAVFVACAGAAVAVGGPPPTWALVAAFVLHASVAPWLLGAGNLVSILNPRAAPMAVQRGGALSQLSGLAGMAIVSAAAGLFALPVLAALHWEEPALLVGAWAGLGAVGAAVYRATLPWVGRLLVRRREALLEAVCGDEP